MNFDNSAQQESTLLAIIAQAEARGAKRADVETYVRRLKKKSSKQLVEQIFKGHANARGFRSWARSG